MHSSLRFIGLLAVLLGASAGQAQEIWSCGAILPGSTPTTTELALSEATELYERWDASAQAWENRTHTTFALDPASHRGERLTQGWDAEAQDWRTPPSRALLTFHPSGAIEEIVYQSYSDVEQGYVNLQRDIATFDAAGRPLTDSREDWVQASQSWSPNRRRVLTRDAEGAVRRSLFERWRNGTWVPDYYETPEYAESGRQTLCRVEWQDSETGAWYDAVRFLSTYDEQGRVVEHLRQAWNGSTQTWKDDRRVLVTYDASGQLAELQTEDHPTAGWEPSRRYLYTYGPGDALLEVRLQDYGSDWADAARLRYTNLVVLAADDVADAGALQMDVWPNPAASPVQVRLRLAAPGAARVDLYDLRGRHVATLFDGAVGTGSIALSLPVDRLAPGLYALRAVTDGGAATRTVSVVR